GYGWGEFNARWPRGYRVRRQVGTRGAQAPKKTGAAPRATPVRNCEAGENSTLNNLLFGCLVGTFSFELAFTVTITDGRHHHRMRFRHQHVNAANDLGKFIEFFSLC